METCRHILSRKNINNDEHIHCLQVKEKLEFFSPLFHDYIVSFSFNCQRQLIAVLRKIVFQTFLIKHVKGMVIILPTQPRDIRKITEGGTGDYGSSSATALLREVAALIC